MKPPRVHRRTEDRTADVWTAAQKNDVDGLEYLLTDGEVDANERNSVGLTPLHFAASRAHAEACEVLIAHGADVNAKDWESCWTPLHMALYHGHLKVSLLLIRHGSVLDNNHDRSGQPKRNAADVRDKEGLSPLDLVSVKLRHWLAQSRLCDEGGDVFTFGKVDYQLGYFLPKADVQSVPKRVKALADVDIIKISAGRYHSMALSKTGQVYAWGFGRGGRLGLGSELNVLEPRLVGALVSKRVVDVSAGENHTLAVTGEGELYSWGSDRHGQLGTGNSGLNARSVPRRIDNLLRIPIATAVAASTHSVAITVGGDVYTWGSNKSGQLGHKEGVGSNHLFPVPRKLESLHSGRRDSALTAFRVALRAAAGPFHTCVIVTAVDRWGPQDSVDAGDVFQWGHGSPVPSKVLFQKPSELTAPSAVWQSKKSPNVLISKVACAKHHSMALSADGSVFTWGAGGDVLGLGSGQETHTGTPQLVHSLLPHGKVVSIAAAQNHCAVVTENGDLVGKRCGEVGMTLVECHDLTAFLLIFKEILRTTYFCHLLRFTWGAGDHGMLGHGSKKWLPTPRKVHAIKRAVDVAAAVDHTIVLLSSSRPPLPPIFPTTELVQGNDDMRPTSLSGLERNEQANELGGTEARVPTLKALAVLEAARAADLRCIIYTLAYANAFYAMDLVKYCVEFLLRNLDAVLVMSGEKDLALLEELSEEVEELAVHSALPIDGAGWDGPEEDTEAPIVDDRYLRELSKSLRSSRKKLRQIEQIEAEARHAIVLTEEQKEKLSRRQHIEGEIDSLEKQMRELFASSLDAFSDGAVTSAKELLEQKNKGKLQTPQPRRRRTSSISDMKNSEVSYTPKAVPDGKPPLGAVRAESHENDVLPPGDTEAKASGHPRRRSSGFEERTRAATEYTKAEKTSSKESNGPPLSSETLIQTPWKSVQRDTPRRYSERLERELEASRPPPVDFSTVMAKEAEKVNRHSLSQLRRPQEVDPTSAPVNELSMSPMKVDLAALINPKFNKKSKPPAWTSPAKPPAASTSCLLSIQVEQAHSQNRSSYSQSSWGYYERRSMPLSLLQQQEQERADYLLALKLAEEEERMAAAATIPTSRSRGRTRESKRKTKIDESKQLHVESSAPSAIRAGEGELIKSRPSREGEGPRRREKGERKDRRQERRGENVDKRRERRERKGEKVHAESGPSDKGSKSAKWVKAERTVEASPPDIA